jgi:hypothetical protein
VLDCTRLRKPVNTEDGGGEFEPEPPTQTKNPTPNQRAAALLADWKECSTAHQRRIERIAAKFASLTKEERKRKP